MEKETYETNNRISLAIVIGFFGAVLSPLLYQNVLSDTLSGFEFIGAIVLSIIIGIIIGFIGYTLGLVYDIDYKLKGEKK